MNKFASGCIGVAASLAWSLSGAAPVGVERGQQIFENKCAMCHSVKKEQGNLAGPNLSGVVGRGVGKAPGFQYSPALANASEIWDEKTLDAFLKAPAVARPGTIMPFSGLKNDQDRAATVTYLKTQAQ